MQLFYIDTIPGSGKTEYFIEQAIELLRNTDPGHVLLYAAPTYRLLEETHRRLIDKFGESDRIHFVTSTDGRPTARIQQLFGRGSSRIEKAKMGSVVLVTQEALLRMDMKQVNFKLTRLFFDETCKIVHGTSYLGRNFADADAPLVDLARDRNYVLSKYNTALKAARSTLNNALQVFHRSQSPFYKETFVVKHIGSKTLGLTAFTIWKPEILFKAFEQVTVTASFFKDSQLYLYLQQNNAHLVNLLAQKNLSPALAHIKKRAELILESTISRARVGVLLQPSDTRVLTSKLLGEGLVFARNSELGTYFDGTPRILRRSVQNVIAAIQEKRGDATSSSIRRALKFEHASHEQKVVAPWVRPPLFVLIERAFSMIHQWSAFYGQEPRTLMIPNSPGLLPEARQRQWLGHIPYANLVATASLFGPPEDGPVNLNLMRTATRKIFQTLTHPDAKVLQEVHTRSKERLLSVSESPVLHGLNTLTDHTVFVHLAALNPTPMQHIFFEFLIPGYDPESDYCADSIAQLLYRTNLRNPKSKRKVLVVLPYEATAQLLEIKLGIAPGALKRTGTPSLIGTNLSQAVVATGERDRADYHGKWFGIPADVKTRVRTMRQSIAQFEKRAKAARANGSEKSADRSFMKGRSKLKELLQMKRDMEIAYSRNMDFVMAKLPAFKRTKA